MDQSLGKLKYEDYGLRVLSAGYQNILCKNSFVMRLERDPVLEQYIGYVQVPCAELDQLNENGDLEQNIIWEYVRIFLV